MPFRQAAGDRDYNNTWNNIHFVNDDLKYVGSSANDFTSGADIVSINETDLTKQAPAFEGIIAESLTLGQFGNIWNGSGARSEKQNQGIAGYLGRYYNEDPNTLIFTKGIANVPNGSSYTKINKDYYIQVAGLTTNRNPNPPVAANLIGVPLFPTTDGDFSLDPETPQGRPAPGAVIECTNEDNEDIAYFPAANINCTAIAQGVNVIKAVTCSRDLVI